MAMEATAVTRELIWRRVMDELGFEHARVRRGPEGTELSGVILVAEQGAPLRAEYSVVCDGAWRTRRVSVTQSWRGEHQTLTLEHDGEGHWRKNGRAEEELAGCTDVDLGLSPSTNALPINRLRLEEGASTEIRAAWIRFPSLEVMPARQGYTRVGPARYRYESLESGFNAMLDVDMDGLPIEYAGIWRRLAEGPAAPEPASRRFVDALVSPGPSDELGDAAATFGWLVGGWAGTIQDHDPDGSVRQSEGEWWFHWVLEGRALQDVFIVPSRRAPAQAGPGANRRYGTTVRSFDRTEGKWQITWISPTGGAINRLAGGREGDRLLLLGEHHGKPIRWSFSDIGPDHFTWRGEVQDGAGNWNLQSCFDMRRIA
ncbi:putative glycolipid-binding domain-containing protein [Corallococcus carmarthensis]|uniref:putative glycolipid-binding domain-containing protein n=1 Tax=Corallococcus carmarthensis TaxID=2316728 RepID=UPI00148C23DF|nr:putative glycolipid-binding domain-containing protein [Corallococcus carmarthensis]NOK17529.1 putative glycolipid-binding domain-containing protein [Corallococcus carmarthensis]